MILFKQANELEKYVELQRQKGNTIGFVPTMGALHDGHVSLLKICNSQTDISICSIFVNPTQFNDPKDFQKYPVTIADDILKLEIVKCDVLFLPSVEEIYPNGTNIEKNYDLGEVEFLLEGEYRPGHFQGVSQVVHRLLEIVHPDKIFVGQKDFQQCIVIKRLIKQLNSPITVVQAETMREASGLAMSSRNMRLSEQEKEKAAKIYQCLLYIKENIAQVPISELITSTTQRLLQAGFSKVDYVAIANADTLQIINEYQSRTPTVALIAAFINDVRLIDNVIINHPTENILS